MNLCYVMWSNIMWKSVSLNFGQVWLNLTHCAALLSDVVSTLRLNSDHRIRWSGNRTIG